MGFWGKMTRFAYLHDLELLDSRLFNLVNLPLPLGRLGGGGEGTVTKVLRVLVARGNLK